MAVLDGIIRNPINEVLELKRQFVLDMQDPRLIEPFEVEEVLAKLKEHPITEKCLRVKIEKIFHMNPSCEHEYLPDIRELYHWMFVFNRHVDFREVINGDKLQRYFLEEFLPISIKYLILCRNFKLHEMMACTEQIIIESLDLTVKMFNELDRYPKFITVAKLALQHGRYFYRLNFQASYLHLLKEPTEQQRRANYQFVEGLREGTEVDALKMETFTGNVIWSRAVITRVNTNVLAVSYLNDRRTAERSVSKSNMEIFPARQFTEKNFEWRLGVKKGDRVDYAMMAGIWKEFRVEEIRELEEEEGHKVYMLGLNTIQSSLEWVCSTSPNVQPPRTFSTPETDKEEIQVSKRYTQQIFKDFNDVLLTKGKFQQAAICRSDYSKSLMIVYLINHLNRKGFFDMITARLENLVQLAPIQTSIELVGFVASFSKLFHREYALNYLPRLTEALIRNVLNSSDTNVRNFSKERLDTLFSSISEFQLRFLWPTERKRKKFEIQPQLAQLFIDSPFLDRKLNSLTIITDLIRTTRLQQGSSNELKKLQQWITDNKIIQKLYHETSHPELIARSSDLLKVYLSSNPPIKSLQPLLELSEPLIKLIVENLGYFSGEFLKAVGKRIVEKELPLDSSVLAIMRSIGGYEGWLLSKGGMGWVEMVKEKKNRAEDIRELLKYPFPIVSKLFLEIIRTDYQFIKAFLKQAIQMDYAQKVLDDPNIQIFKKVQFLRPYYKYTPTVDQRALGQIDTLWQLILSSPSPTKNVFDKFIQVLQQVQPNQTQPFFQKHFTKLQDLRRVAPGSFAIMKKLINNMNGNFEYGETTTPGLNELINLIFENENLLVIKQGLELMNHLIEKSQLEEAFKEGFLEKCLLRLYEGGNYEKYLAILASILNQSEMNGNGNLNPISKQLPPETLHYTVLNHFNELRTRIHMTVNSNLTLYELRHEIGKALNAFSNEIKIYSGGEKLVDEHLNALPIGQIDLKSPLSIMKKFKINRVQLIRDGKLVEDAANIIRIIFNEYSSNGLMSKADCKRLQKKTIGDSIINPQTKVNKIFSYDANKDGYLSFNEFLEYYTTTAKAKPSTVWANFEALGIREDLKILGDIGMEQPEPSTLPRYSLVRNEKFMSLLFELLKKEKLVAECAWRMLSRLPICLLPIKYDKENKYHFRYWLYFLDYSGSDELLTDQDLEKVLTQDDETLAIGLQVAYKQNLEIGAHNFNQLMQRIQAINSQSVLTMYGKAVLKFVLQIIAKAIESQPRFKQQFLRSSTKFQSLLLSGLMNPKPQLRNIYMYTVTDMFQKFNSQKDLFSLLFNMVYTNFEKCNKKDLSPEYFVLFTGALEMARSNQILEQLGGHELLGTIVKVFKEHESTERSLSAQEDYVAIGFMKLIETLLTPEVKPTGFVEFLFRECLFPQQRDNKHELKSTKSRKQAYELIYRMCQSDRSELDQLFKSGFKSIYKSIANVKISYYFKQVRSEYGYAGLRNLGCICYMIAMLQQFFLTVPFRYLLLMAQDGMPQHSVQQSGRSIDDNLLHQLQSMFSNLQLTQKQEYNPQDFCYAFKDFQGNPVNVGRQQDAQQFLNMLFDRVQQSIKHTPFRHLVDSIYGGKYCNLFVCSSCKHVFERHENFYNLSLQVKSMKDIRESFNKFITGETISDYKCDNCQKKCDTTKRCLLSRLPNYLIIYLQRVCLNYDTMENEKINTRWEFPHQLNLFDYTLDKEKGGVNSSQYDYVLKGIVVHIGSAEYGHYFSYIKTPEGIWLEYNDERVRQFDPKDIEDEAFGGGTGWRKDNQSAYLLLYEKVNKNKFPLEFNSEEQRQQVMERFHFKDIMAKPQPQKQQTITLLNDKEEQRKPQQSSEDKKPQVIKAQIDLLSIQPYIPQKARSEIRRANEQFTLQIHITSSEFMQFLYRIALIDPPEHLKSEFLELCYECFPLKQTIGDTSLGIADEMPKRFNELIKGSGWEFFEKQSRHWNKDLFNLERSMRIGTKRLIISVLGDILASQSLNETTLQSVHDYLLTLLNLMKDELQDSWLKMQQYFETWIQLVRTSNRIREFALQQKMTEIILDFILGENSPLKLVPNKKRMGTRCISPCFDHAFELLFELISDDYKFSQNEQKCFVSYSFLEKLVKISSKKPGFIKSLCRDNTVISERIAYCVTEDLMKVTHSDSSKPLIETIIEYITLEDDLKQKRMQWMIGLPQLQYHPKTQSYGMYNLTTVHDAVYWFYSPLSILPVMHIFNYMREKYDHVTILLMTMLLQLEREGHVNLTRYPSHLPLQRDFTSPFEPQVNNYNEQMNNSKGAQKIPEQYKNYATKLYNLWHERPEMPMPDRYIIGKTVAQTQFRTHSFPAHSLQIVQTEYTSWIVKAQYDQQNTLRHIKRFLHKTNPSYFTFDSEVVESAPHADQFLKKSASIISNNSDDDKKQSQQPSPFDKAFKCDYMRKITLKNNSGSDMMVLMRFNPAEGINTWVPTSPIRYILRGMGETSMVITKERAEEEWGEYDLEVDIEQSGNVRFRGGFPQQLITPCDVEEQAPSEDDEDSLNNYSY